LIPIPEPSFPLGTILVIGFDCNLQAKLILLGPQKIKIWLLMALNWRTLSIILKYLNYYFIYVYVHISTYIDKRSCLLYKCKICYHVKSHMMSSHCFSLEMLECRKNLDPRFSKNERIPQQITPTK
jgi:hypothetical protein